MAEPGGVVLDLAPPGRLLVECRGLVVGYAGKPLLPPIDLTLRRGQICAVVGRNGSGKTTWFRTLLGLLPPVAGRVEVAAPVRFGYIPQRVRLDPLVPLRAVDVATLGVERQKSFLRPFLGAEARRRVGKALAEMDATALADRRFGELSEGQKQRVLMARLLAGEPDLAVLDEPTAAMDEVAERETLARIDRLRHDHGVAVLIVTHHLPAVSRFADQVLFLDRDAQAVVSGSASEVFAHPGFRARYGPVAAPPVARPEDEHVA
jgi:zinc transport system ATP-binding protein